MAAATVYDKAKWHYEGDYPRGLSQVQAFVHTGMFLGWVIDNGLYSEEFGEDCEEDIEAFRQRSMTGPEVYRRCDGVLADDMLSTTGNRFVRFYFDFKKGAYLRDYKELLAARLPSLYHVLDTWENYDRLKARIDQRFQEWKDSRGKKNGKKSPPKK